MAGPYTIETVIAQTGHSRVYSVRDERGRSLALKELHFASVPDSSTLDAFDREAEMLRRLNHPAIPKCYDSFTEGKGVGHRLYIAFAWVAGENLAQRIARGRLQEAELQAIAEHVLEILIYLQSLTPAVIHRDVKPGNIIIGPDARVSLVDFGSVRQVDGSRTHRSTLVGTFGYMPPEQLGGTVSLSSDVYGLAATLLHAATGQLPSDIYASSGGPILPPATPIGLRPWLEKALQTEPRARFHTAEEALAALHHPELLKKPKPSRIGLAVVAGIALAGAVWGGLWAADLAGHVAEAPPVARPAAQTWFEAHKAHCNQVEVNQLFLESPPPTDPTNTGCAAACLALAGKIPGARERVLRLAPNDRFPAIQILFNLVHPVADKGDDAATGPIMKLVVEFWPNNYQALFHLGIAEYVANDTASAKEHLEAFLKLYSQPDSFTSRARTALARISQGLPAEPGTTSAH